MRKTYNIELPILSNITPSIESAVLKLVEEVGEVAERVGKYRGINGENFKLPDAEENKYELFKELIDVLQSTATILNTLGVTNESISDYLKTIHLSKMISRGYY
jgi:NTP pyrophosphatase (non-canonical NTP hydrolase)